MYISNSWCLNFLGVNYFLPNNSVWIVYSYSRLQRPVFSFIHVIVPISSPQHLLFQLHVPTQLRTDFLSLSHSVISKSPFFAPIFHSCQVYPLRSFCAKTWPRSNNFKHASNIFVAHDLCPLVAKIHDQYIWQSDRAMVTSPLHFVGRLL